MNEDLIIIVIIGVVAVSAFSFYFFYWRPNRKIVSYNGKLLGRINHVRKKAKLKPLGRVTFLDKIAAEHSKDMSKYGNCDHEGIEGRSDLIQWKSGMSGVGENVCKYPAKGYSEQVARGMVRGWMKSPSHRANILNARFKRTGIGIKQRNGYIYATQIFTN